MLAYSQIYYRYLLYHTYYHSMGNCESFSGQGDKICLSSPKILYNKNNITCQERRNRVSVFFVNPFDVSLILLVKILSFSTIRPVWPPVEQNPNTSATAPLFLNILQTINFSQKQLVFYPL